MHAKEAFLSSARNVCGRNFGIYLSGERSVRKRCVRSVRSLALNAASCFPAKGCALPAPAGSGAKDAARSAAICSIFLGCAMRISKIIFAARPPWSLPSARVSCRSSPAASNSAIGRVWRRRRSSCSTARCGLSSSRKTSCAARFTIFAARWQKERCSVPSPSVRRS